MMYTISNIIYNKCNCVKGKDGGTMSEKSQGDPNSQAGNKIPLPDEFSELGSLDPNVDQNLSRLSGTV